MFARFSGPLSRLAVLAGTATVLAACSVVGGTSSPSTTPSAAAKLASPKQAILLAAAKAQRVTSFSATMDVVATAQGQDVTMSGTLREQLSPSLLVDASFPTLQGGGQSLPGGLEEILTSQAVYIKMSVLTQALHTSKPWVKMPVDQLGKLSGSLKSAFSQAKTDNPLAHTQMFKGSPDIHKVGTGAIGGVPVTEYAGSVPIDKAVASLPTDMRDRYDSLFTELGVKVVKFHIWLDAQNQTRKVALTMAAKNVTESITETITSINQPVSVTVPASGETYTLSSSQLGGI